MSSLSTRWINVESLEGSLLKLSTRWINMEFLEGGLLKLMLNILKSVALRAITNIAQKGYTFHGKLKKEFPYKCICSVIQKSILKWEFLHRYFSRILLIDSELPTIKIEFFEGTLLIDFRIVTYLNIGLSQKYSWSNLFIDFKTSATKISHLKLQ